jgi:hypothetical protein
MQVPKSVGLRDGKQRVVGPNIDPLGETAPEWTGVQQGGEEPRLAELGARGNYMEGIEPNDRCEVPVVGRRESAVVELGGFIPYETEQWRLSGR